MRVLLVGNVFGRELAANFYFTMEKLLHGFARAGHAVQVFNDRDAARMATPFRTRKLGAPRANRRLVCAAANFRPDLVLLGHCEMIANATVGEIRDAVPGVRVVYRNVDPLHTAWNRELIARRGPAVDAVFVTTAGAPAARLETGRSPVYFMPNPVDPAVETLRGFTHTDQAYDLFFAIGSPIDSTDPRVAIAERLAAALPEVAFDFRGMHGKPAQRGAGYFDLLRNARMGLSFSRVNDHYLYSSGRMAQYMGNGLLTFLDRATGFGDIFGEDELGFYDDVDELCDKIRHYRANDAERRTVAERGWKKAHDLFDCRKVADFIIDATFGTGPRHAYAWPTAPQRPPG